MRDKDIPGYSLPAHTPPGMKEFHPLQAIMASLKNEIHTNMFGTPGSEYCFNKHIDKNIKRLKLLNMSEDVDLLRDLKRTKNTSLIKTIFDRLKAEFDSLAIYPVKDVNVEGSKALAAYRENKKTLKLEMQSDNTEEFRVGLERLLSAIKILPGSAIKDLQNLGTKEFKVKAGLDRLLEDKLIRKDGLGHRGSPVIYFTV